VPKPKKLGIGSKIIFAIGAVQLTFGFGTLAPIIDFRTSGGIYNIISWNKDLEVVAPEVLSVKKWCQNFGSRKQGLFWGSGLVGTIEGIRKMREGLIPRIFKSPGLQNFLLNGSSRIWHC
jgi:hypothetical protein